MRKLVKIVLITSLILLVVFAVLVDLPIGKSLLTEHLDLALYLKLVSLLGLLIAFFISIGFKHRVDASQKYRRANTVLVEAQTKAERQKQTSAQIEKDLKKAYAQKEKALNHQIKDAYVGYEARLKDLKQQNFELKEALAKLMHVLKREREERN